ncbi:MAG: alpha-L-fucosidase, partial [Phycisphaerae bacterium]|nr:alpha-L-fucosidase [Phycisphaerae bacterium]
MKSRIAATCIILGMIVTAYSATSEINKTKLPDEARAKQVRDMKWGMFICWSFSSFAGQEWTPTIGKDASYFKATGCDTDQWCKTAKEAGMGYILFLAKHHDGFCLWDTKTTDKKVTNSPLGVDVLAKLRKSCD